MVSPPLILTLTMQEAGRLDEYLDYFTEMGFEIAPFGGREYAVSAVPGNLFGIAEKELFLATMVQAATPVAANAVLFAVQYKRDSELASKLVAVSTVLSIITIPILTILAQTLC